METFKEEKNNEMNLLTAFHTVLKESKESELSESYFKSVEKELSIIREKLGTNAMESTILAVVINENVLYTCKNEDFCRHFNINGMMLMELDKDIQSLINKRLIFKGSGRNSRDVVYAIPEPLQNAIINNMTYMAPSRKCCNERDFFQKLDGLFDKRGDKIINVHYLQEECMRLLEENKNLTFVKDFTELTRGLDKKEVVLLLLSCIFYYRGIKDTVSPRDWRMLFESKFECNMVENDLNSGESPLIVNKLLEPNTSDSEVLSNTFKITNEFKKMLFPEQVSGTNTPTFENLISYKKIASRTLFFNPEIQSQVDTLSTLLEEKQFGIIRKRLKNSNMNGGFCCLFYGEAGAGKTELVKQLAKRTKRDLFMVDMSQLRSKWVGESEKNIQEIFNQYNQMIRNCKRQPIMLFNEADAIMTKRMASAERSADKMENTIANIILQNMEDFDDGILIATTNLAETNMDPAYERRFLYKLKFDRPNPEVRRKIWGSMLKDVDERVVEQLSREYDFTGGQIINIQKKKLVDEILYGAKNNYGDLRDYCEQERISGTIKHHQIGFKKDE